MKYVKKIIAIVMIVQNLPFKKQYYKYNILIYGDFIYTISCFYVPQT